MPAVTVAGRMRRSAAPRARCARCARYAAAALVGTLAACAGPARDPRLDQPLPPVPPAAQLEQPVTPAPEAATAPNGAPQPAPVRLAVEPGLYRCELGRRVLMRRVDPDRRTLVLSWQGRDHTFAAVPARTGALRYESVQSGLMWLVIVGKSMLLDTRRGIQLANECRL